MKYQKRSMPLTLWIGEETNAYTNYASMFGEIFSKAEIDIQISVLPQELIDGVLQSELSDMPDLILVESREVYDKVSENENLFLPVCDYEDMCEYVLSSVAASVMAYEQCYAYPVTGKPAVMYYNSDLSNTDSMDWDSFIEDCEHYWGEKAFPNYPAVINAIKQTRGELFYNEYGHIITDGAFEVLELYAKLNDANLLNDDIPGLEWDIPPQQRFEFIEKLKAGTYYSIIGDASWMNLAMQQDLSVTTIPKFDDIQYEANLGGACIMIINKHFYDEPEIMEIIDELNNSIGRADISANIIASYGFVPVTRYAEQFIDDYSGLGQDNLIGFFIELLNNVGEIYYGEYSYALNMTLFNCAHTDSNGLVNAYNEFLDECKYYGAAFSGLNGIIVKQQPQKTTYYKYEYFSTIGMEICAVYSNGLSLQINNYEYSPHMFKQAGAQAVTVTYIFGNKEYSTEVDVTVIDRSLKGIKAEWNKTPCFEGERISVNSFNVYAQYNIGPDRQVYDFEIFPDLFEIGGEHTVTVTYDEDGIRTSCDVNIVVVPRLESISVEKLPDKRMYANGERFCSMGMQVAASYSDGTSQTVPVGSIEVTPQTIRFKGGEESKKIKLSYTRYGITVSTYLTVYKKTGALLDDCNIEQGMGSCGTGKINLYSGELTYIFEDYVGTDSVTPIRIAHVYGKGSGNTHGVGNDWRLNIQQEVFIDDGHWHYIDKDGKDIVFDGGFSSDSGRSAIRNEKTGFDLFQNSASVTLIDRKNNSLVFELINGIYRLTAVHIFPSAPANVIDEYSMKIEYDGALPVAVTAGRKVENKRPCVRLIYTDGLLTAMNYVFDGTVKIAEYTYSGSALEKITKLDGNVDLPYSASVKFATELNSFCVYDLSCLDAAGNYKCLKYGISYKRVTEFAFMYGASDIEKTVLEYGGERSTVFDNTADVVAYTYTECNGSVSVTSFCQFGVVSQYSYEKGDGVGANTKPKTVYNARSRGFDYKALADEYSDTLDMFHDDFASDACEWINGVRTSAYSVNGNGCIGSGVEANVLQKSYTVSDVPNDGRTVYLSLWALAATKGITITAAVTHQDDTTGFKHVLKAGLGKKWHFTAFCLGKVYNDDVITVNVTSNERVYIDDVRITEAPYETPDNIPDNAYDSFGNITSSYEYDPVANGILRTDYTYNSDHQITKQAVTKNYSAVSSVEYEYLIEEAPDSSAGSIKYRNKGLLASVKRYGKSASLYTEEQYSYKGYVQSSACNADNVTTSYTQSLKKHGVTVDGGAETPSIVTETEVYTNSDFVESLACGDDKNSYMYTGGGSLKTARFGYNGENGYDSEITFEYDSFGNISSVKIGTVKLVTLDYDSKHLNSTTYADGCKVSYEYDDKDRITEIDENGELFASVAYSYDSGNTVTVTHANGLVYTDKSVNKNGITSEYTAAFGTDNADKLRVSGMAATRPGNVTRTAYYIGNAVIPFETRVNTLNYEGLLTKTERIWRTASVEYRYDDLNRIKQKKATVFGAVFAQNYSYVKINAKRCGSAVNGETFSVNGVQRDNKTYAYGKTGALVSASNQSGIQNKYTYDDCGRIVWEHNYALGRAVKYFYDGNGNITQKQTYAITDGAISQTPINTDIYDYTTVTADCGQNPAWRDQLKSYNGSTFKYDKCGNPVEYKGKALSWQGRKLASFDGTAMEYDYKGLRVKKGGNKYFWCDGKLIYEKRSNGSIYYYYDESDISGMCVDGFDYYFKKNVLGDVEEIYDKNGVLQCRYVYDAWGNHKIFDGAGNEVLPEDSNIGNANPIRYRGYYWDSEFKLYYLQSRYYDPEICRFISPDGVEYLDPQSICGFNLYAYCNDNPVMNVDPNGTLVSTILGALFGGLWGGLSALFNGQDIWRGILAGMASGALSGLAVDLASVITAFIPITGGAALLAGFAFAAGLGFGLGALGEYVGQNIRGEQLNTNSIWLAGGINAATSILSFGVSFLANKAVGKSTRNLFKMLLPEYTPPWSWAFQSVVGWALPSFATAAGAIIAAQNSVEQENETDGDTAIEEYV